MEEKMKRLMELLNDDSNKEILESEHEEWEDDDDEDWDEGGNYIAEFGYYAKYKDEAIEEEIEELAGSLFTHNAHPNYSNIKEFEHMSGYEVGPGESDSFGWLRGVISKDDTMYICWG
jgi:hypothetical protein